MINVLVIFMESITMWLCLHIAFCKKIKCKKSELLFFVPYITVCVLCSYKIMDKIIYLGLWLFVFVWCKKVFNKSAVINFFRTAIGIISVSIIELIVMFIYSLFAFEIDISMEIECLIVGIVVLNMAIILYYCLIINKNKPFKQLLDVNIIICIIFSVAFVLYAKLEFEINNKMPIIYVFFFLLLFVYFIILCKKQKSIFELEKKTLSMDLQNMYGTAYDELLKDVRRRQHDYKNQLATLKSVVEMSGTAYDIKHLQSDYLSIIESENEINSLLSKCCNPIVAGCIYNMYRKYREAGIRLDVDVNTDDSEINIKTKDAVEILGVFVTNACEHVEDFEPDDRVVRLRLYNKGDKLTIDVRNIAEPILYKDMPKLFWEGYSTKGENRGIGLASVKAIAKKYNTGVNIDNILVGDKNWVSFNITI